MATSSFLHNYKVSGKKAQQVKKYLDNSEKIPKENKLRIDNFNERIQNNRKNEAMALKKMKSILSHL